MRRALLAAVLAASTLVGCGPEAPEGTETLGDPEREATEDPVVLSLRGEPLTPGRDTTGAVSEALAALEADPDNLELVLQAGHAYAAARDFIPAIRLYDRAVALAPEDWRGYRYRGHRFLSIRRFPRALSDLESARELSPYSFDVAYHLGLAHYVSGNFAAAVREYRRCVDLSDDPDALALEASGQLGDGFRSCMSIATNDNTRVAITDWLYRALRRDGRPGEAQALLDRISPDMEITSNTAYHHALLFYKGVLDEEVLLDPESPAGYRVETIAYPVANWHLTEGDTVRAVSLLESAAGDPHWHGFGRIAAEADLVALAGR